MVPYGEPPKSVPSQRPIVSGVTKGPTGGSSFTVAFLPGQELPTHRNASRILISVVSGAGTITVAEEQGLGLTAGKVLQLDANVPHALVAGEAGMLIEVHLVADCCPSC